MNGVDLCPGFGEREKRQKAGARGETAAIGSPHVAAFSPFFPPPPERALLDLKASITNWDDFQAANKLQGWSESESGSNDTTTVCAWTGVTCDADHRVVALDLGCASLPLCRVKANGSLPSTLTGLSHLRLLALTNQSFRGALPPAWGAAGAFPHLVTLDVSLNHLSGGLPAWGGGDGLHSLTTLALARNELAGGVPPEWAHLTSLKTVALYHNGLSGALPASVTHALPNATLWIKPGNWMMCDGKGGVAGAAARVCSVDGSRATTVAPMSLTDTDCDRVPSLGRVCRMNGAPPTRAAMPASPQHTTTGMDAALGAVLRLRGTELLPFGTPRETDVEDALAGVLGVRRSAVSVTQALAVDEGGTAPATAPGVAQRRLKQADNDSQPPLDPLIPGDGGNAETAPPTPDKTAVDVSVRVLLRTGAPDAAASLERALVTAAEDGSLLASLKKAGLPDLDAVQLLVTLPLQPEPLTAADAAALAASHGVSGGQRRVGLIAAVVAAAAAAGCVAGVGGWAVVRACAARRAAVADDGGGGKTAEAGGRPTATLALAPADSASSKDAGGGSGGSIAPGSLAAAAAAAAAAATTTPSPPPSLPSPHPDWSTIPESDLAISLRPDGTPWLLGEGAYGRVYRGTLRGVQPVAVKALHAGGSAESFAQECALLRDCRCPNVVAFLGMCWPAGGGPLLVTEFCSGGDLFRALARPNAAALFAWHKWGRRVAADVSRGLAFLHARRVVHFDLKSNNVLLTSSGEAKIADVGLARACASSYVNRTDGAIGTLSHSAPELILGLKCSEKADMFSFGVVLWEIVTRLRPVRGQMRDLVPGEVPDEVAALLRQCLDPDPRARPTAREACRVLTGHPGDAIGVNVVAGLAQAGQHAQSVAREAAAAAVAAAAAASTSDSAAPPTPFAAACQSPFASGGGVGASNPRDAPLALRVAAAARAALARARRKREGEDDDEDVGAVAAFL